VKVQLWLWCVNVTEVHGGFVERKEKK